MYKLDSDGLICDMAQTYHVYDMRALPLRTVAVLASGLGPQSRIMQKIKPSFSLEEQLLARASDALQLLLWTKCKEGTPKPALILEAMSRKRNQTDPQTYGFASAEDFEKARANMLKGGE